jgi:hypothetical protein
VEAIDVWRTAQILIDGHGENAWLEASQRADHALEDNNPEGVKLWKKVVTAIDELQREKPATGEAIN